MQGSLSGVSRIQSMQRNLAFKSNRKFSHKCRSKVSTVDVSKMPKWELIYRYLVLDKKLKSVKPEDAQKLVATNEWLLLDVRPKATYDKAHIQGALSAPIYQPLDMSKADAGKVLKFIAYSFNGVNPIEPNPNYFDDVQKAISNGKGVIVYCETGGTIKPSINFQYGKASRSLQAAFKIFEAELTDKILHLDGGAFAWFRSGLPFDGEYDSSVAAKSPDVAAEPTGYYVNNKKE